MSLRDKLLAALADLPGTRTFHVHVLTSSPRKHTGLFPYAHPRPRTYLQDVFVLLSEQGPEPDALRVLVTALEASVYHIPSSSCGVLYISKVDSSGHAASPSPTPALVRAFLTYYADPVTRPIAVRHLWIQLFARAQNQYLFPNSSEYEGKRPLSDVRLCAWWKRIYGEVAAGVQESLKGTGKVRLFYVLPGYSELEAVHSLTRSPAGNAASSAVQWAYGHPYSQDDIPLPCTRSTDPDAPQNLGNFIPWFDDDPKSRFLDEIAHTTTSEAIRSPKRKRPRPPSSSGPRKERKSTGEPEHDAEEKDKEKEKEKDAPPRIEGELSQVSPDEFWERMSFRQECVAGAVTGFFTLGVSTPPAVEPARASQPSPLAPQPGQVAAKMVQRVVSSLMKQHEFSTRERALRATETLEGAIRGLCEDAPVLPAPAPATVSGAAPESSTAAAEEEEKKSNEPDRPRTPEPARPTTLDVPHTPPPGRSHLRARARSGAGGGGGLPELSPNPFPDPVATPETYAAHIYGSITVRNPAKAVGGPHAPGSSEGAGKGTGAGAGAGTGTGTGVGVGVGADGAGQAAAPEPKVTVLAVRKKRKAGAS